MLEKANDLFYSSFIVIAVVVWRLLFAWWLGYLVEHSRLPRGEFFLALFTLGCAILVLAPLSLFGFILSWLPFVWFGYSQARALMTANPNIGPIYMRYIVADMTISAFQAGILLVGTIVSLVTVPLHGNGPWPAIVLGLCFIGSIMPYPSWQFDALVDVSQDDALA